MTPYEKLTSDLEATRDSLIAERKNLVYGTWPDEARRRVQVRLLMLSELAKSIMDEMDSLDREYR